MKRIMSCLACFLLVACQANPFAAHPTAKEKAASEQAELVKKARQVINQQLHKKEYPFQMMVDPMRGKRRFLGKQAGEDWSLKELPSRELVMQRKEERIYAYHRSKTEVMTTWQAGLVSPRDHLAFVLEMAKSYRKGPSIQVNGQKADVIEVDIDEGKLLDKIKQTLFHDAAIALPDKMKVAYKLAVVRPHRLVRVTLLIQAPDREQVQQLTYEFI
ncbi:hypothetical protein [Laceyella putida]|uniref:Lipoprotein n=1 Tax=Laceyella putida TaxID=110101 RepID=A0ABW2RHT6_9BACL